MAEGDVVTDINDMTGYRGLAAAIVINALANYSCRRVSCERITTVAGRGNQAVRRAICVNCQRDAEGFLYSDWCHALLEWLNLDQELLIQTMTNLDQIGDKLHSQGKRRAYHKRKDDPDP